MAVPGYQEFMYPLLEELKDGNERTLQELTEKMADYFNLTLEDREELIPSGRQRLVANRVGWAKTYLNKAGLIRTIRRGVFIINEKGMSLVADPSVTFLDKSYLMKYEEFNDFINKKQDEQIDKTPMDQSEERTPSEIMGENYNLLKQEVQDELLDRILECSPAFFENLIVELIVAMGYGGSFNDAGKAVGKSGDGGIDGIIKEDVLGLEMIYLQAKRWNREAKISRPDIQSFVGSLVGKQASKGIFITTAKFTQGAYEYAQSIDKRVILIDGDRLTDLMFQYNVGVTDAQIFVIKRVDQDFFEV